MTHDEARQNVKWALRRMPWHKLERLAQALEDLGEDAVPVLRQLAKDKHERASAGDYGY